MPATIALDFAVQSVPGFGDAYSFLTGAIGYDPILDATLSPDERGLATGSAFAWRFAVRWRQIL